MGEQDEPSPEFPYTVTVTWAVGDSLTVSYPDLMPWEARAALEEALAQIRSDEQTDTEREEQE